MSSHQPESVEAIEEHEEVSSYRYLFSPELSAQSIAVGSQKDETQKEQKL